MKKGAKRLMFLFLAIIILHAGIIIIYGFVNSPKKSAYLVILGNKVKKNGEPSKRLKYCLNKGIALFKKEYADTLIVSGGMGKEGFDEASIMANYLIQKGVPKDRILQDKQGNNTFLSAKNSLELMANHKDKSIIIVSQYFHLLRSKIAFNKMGMKEVSVARCDYFFEWRDFYSILREIIGIYYYLFRSHV